MANKKRLGVIGWLLSVLVFIALINWLTFAWFDFNIVEAITFGVSWLATTIYTIVGIVGIVGLINLILKTFK